MQTSEQINEIAAALAKAQGTFQTIEKRKQASVKGVSKQSGKEYSISYAYADIADVISAVTPMLSRENISFTQPTVMIDGSMFIITRLMHSSGQWLESLYPVCGLSGDHQKMGGALTYARRYALCSMIGVAADEDIDGQHAERAEAPTKKPEKQIATNEPPPSAPIDDSFPGDTPPLTAAQEYMRDAIGIINNWTANVVKLKEWWEDETPHRERAGVVNPSNEYAMLFEAFKHRGMSLAGMIKSRAA